MHHVFANRLQILLGCDTTTSEFNDRLRGLAIPNTYVVVSFTLLIMIHDAFRTVTGNDDKLIIIRYIVNSNFRKGGDNLLLRREIRTLLELEITNGTREGKIAIDSSEIDESSCCADSCLLACGASVV